MEDLASFLSDLASGPGVPAVHSLSLFKSDAAWIALAGAGLGLALSAADKYARPAPAWLEAARHLLSISLSAAQLFSAFDLKDRDVGAGLVAVPLFFAACMPPTCALPDYARHCRLLSSALAFATLLAATVYFSLEDSPANPVPPSASGGDLLRALSVANVAYAASAGGSGGLASTALRGAAYLGLGFVPSATRGLLAGPHPLVVLAAYGVSLAWSAHHAACRARIAMSSAWSQRDPQRSLMLAVAPALAVGFVERRGDPANAYFAVLAVVGVGLLQAALPAKFAGRQD